MEVVYNIWVSKTAGGGDNSSIGMVGTCHPTLKGKSHIKGFLVDFHTHFERF